MGLNWVFFEAVNFDETVYDEDALPSIRGASYALLKAPGVFAQKLKPVRSIEFSSSILCEVEMNEAAIDAAFFNFLVKPESGDNDLDATLKTMSFSFGIAESSGDDGNFKYEYLAARITSQRNRFRLQSARHPSDKRKVLGNCGNRDAYYKALGVTMPDRPLEFPEDFNSLVAEKPGWVPEKFRYKMAVLEFDADRLGGVLPLTSFEEFKAASKQQHDLMTGLIQDVFNASISDDGKLDLETLLFAGDEGILVFPVWNLQKIMKLVSNHLCAENALTSFSLGLVICGRKTPILTVRRLTRELIRANKGVRGHAPHTGADSLIQYVVAGDMDVFAGSVAKYRERILGFQPSEQNTVFPLKLARFDEALTLLRRAKARDADGTSALASHSKIKAAIDTVRRYGTSIRESENPDAKAAMAVVDALVVDEESPSPLVGGNSKVGYCYFGSLLHAAALMPFLPDEEREADEVLVGKDADDG